VYDAELVFMTNTVHRLARVPAGECEPRVRRVGGNRIRRIEADQTEPAL